MALRQGPAGGGRAARPNPGPRSAEARSGDAPVPDSRGQALQDGVGHPLALPPELIHRADARRAPRPAGAGREDGPRPREEVIPELEETLRKADPARVAVVEIEGRLEVRGREEAGARPL